MKNLIKTVAIGAILICGSASAADNQQTAATFSGSVANTCVLDPMTQLGGTGASLVAGATTAAATVNLTNIADATTALYNTGNGINLQFSGYCNYAHTIRVQTLTGNLKNVTTANNPVPTSNTFIQSLNYTVLGLWGTSVIALTADGPALKKSVGGALSGSNRGTGTLAITISDPADTSVPMQAGSYTDVLRMQIGLPL